MGLLKQWHSTALYVVEEIKSIETRSPDPTTPTAMSSKSTTFRPHYIKAKRGFSTVFLDVQTLKGKSITVSDIKRSLLAVLQVTNNAPAVQSDPLLAEQSWETLIPDDLEIAEIVNAEEEEAKAFEFAALQENEAAGAFLVVAWRLKSEKNFAVERYPENEQEE
ncbi:hypothetical protein BCR37DRAFT_390798 [Protomyces lactucae-debilis]|uniref:Uncharacterized protein n=1 Tax=Protomyces lactucae-debilis TaxID=2754530 RepID=A0A1Y2FWN7_PROLT|nr:uncharacterized protein BCR37DRAFT_390798 [Protomyces lactucae-debilis]ORY87085.1 hypothetical protein BCR37DRAFT_390798 [Protomyces lactucae-debilis]